MFSIALHKFGLCFRSIVEPLFLLLYTLLTQFSHSSEGGAVRPNPALTPAKRSSFAPIASVLPAIGMTQRRLKQLEAIHLVREQREQRKQDLAFNARPFILCGIPLRRPPQNQMTYCRRNGKFSLDITAHPRFGMPFGQDRLILIWVATLAVRQRNRTVHFESASQLLDYFDLPKNGYHYHRVIQAFQRIFGATIFFGTDADKGRAVVSDWVRFHFFDKLELWYTREEATKIACYDHSANSITLSAAFYDEIDQHPIPVERPVVASLANAPGALDLYVWLAWKSWTLKGKPMARIPLFGEKGLVSQLGSAEYTRGRRFREKLGQWLRLVRAFWPDCQASISSDGQFLLVSHDYGLPAVKSPQLPVNS